MTRCVRNRRPARERGGFHPLLTVHCGSGQGGSEGIAGGEVGVEQFVVISLFAELLFQCLQLNNLERVML